MQSDDFYPVPKKTAQCTLLNNDTYLAKYHQSVKNPELFWKEQAMQIDWFVPFEQVKESCFSPDNFFIRWYKGGKTNASFNCLDRHLPHRKDQIAIYWEGDTPGKERKITYQQLYEEVCRCANALKSLGIKKGDVVTIYMPMAIESIVAMLACSRIGAIHSVVFAGFSANALADRIRDSQTKLVITADESIRGGKYSELKKNVDVALAQKQTESVQNVLVLKNTGGNITWEKGRDCWWHEIVTDQPATCPATPMDSEAPLFILYTSGSTGKPKALVHTTGGYLVYAFVTFLYVFDYHESDIYWCTADIGWITGHTYVTYGPLLNGGAMVIHEGTYGYPYPNRLSKIIDKYQVNILYTAPTAIRAMMALGNETIKDTSRDSLRVLGSVGEPLNPEAWHWYYEVIGKKCCPIVDTWWQTETGGVMIAPLPGATRTRVSCATRPFFGVQPLVVDEKGKQQKPGIKGHLVIQDSWPGQARTILGNPQRFIDTYFTHYPGYYFTGDGAFQDDDGYFWITGRVDDVINISGHRLNTAEIEGAAASDPHVNEAAAVGISHPVKGEAIYIYAVPCDGVISSVEAISSIRQTVRTKIGPIATPEIILLIDDLPKTRSGKIMRRILRKIANDEENNLGDISTIANQDIIDSIIKQKAKNKVVISK